MKLFFKNLIIKITAMAILLAFVASQNVSAMNQNGHGNDDDDMQKTMLARTLSLLDDDASMPHGARHNHPQGAQAAQSQYAAHTTNPGPQAPWATNHGPTFDLKTRYTPLMEAANKNDGEALAQYLTYIKINFAPDAYLAEINCRSNNLHGDTALHSATRHWDQHCFDQLLRAEADPTTTDLLTRDAPMHTAVKFRNLSAIIAFVNYYTNTNKPLLDCILNQPNGEAKTPLMLAAEIGDSEAVKHLLGGGARPDISRPDFYEGPKTALEFALQGPPQTTQNTRRIGSKEDYNRIIQTLGGPRSQAQGALAAGHTAPQPYVQPQAPKLARTFAPQDDDE